MIKRIFLALALLTAVAGVVAMGTGAMACAYHTHSS